MRRQFGEKEQGLCTDIAKFPEAAGEGDEGCRRREHEAMSGAQ
jgi:hypothetical protein